jgi:glycosyltransferase involved in cell wall biosynthesis
MPVDLETHELPVKIVFSGRFGKRKGVYDLINAFNQAHFRCLWNYISLEMEK